MTKTPEQGLEDFIKEQYVPDAPYRTPTPEVMKYSFYAGRKHFIEHELREYLEMARDGGYNGGLERFMFTHEDNEIIQKALEG